MAQLTMEQVNKLIEDVVGTSMAKALEELKAAQKENYAKAMLTGIGDPEGDSRGPAPKAGKGNIGQIVRALASNKGNVQGAAAYAKKYYGEDSNVTKALSASDGAAGGFLIEEVLSNEVIEFIRPNTVVRASDPIIMPMPEGNLSIPRVGTGSTGSYIGENTNLPNTAQKFEMVKLSYKKLAALVPISNDLLRFQSPEADAIIRDDVARAMAQAEDLAFLRGNGTAFSPKGLRYWVQAANTTGTAGTSLANMITDLNFAVLALENANIMFVRPVWFLSPRTKQALMTVQNSNGFYVFRAEMLTGKLWGFPFKTTTQIPTNLGSGSDSEIYLTDMIHAVIGESKSLIIDASSEAAYYDGTTVQAAFSLDQTVVRAIAEHDFVLRHDFATAVVTGVDY